MKKLFCFTFLAAVTAMLLMLSASAANTNTYSTDFACFSKPIVDDDTYIGSDAYFNDDNRTFYILNTNGLCKIIGGECRSYENHAVMEMEGDALKITLDENTPDYWFGEFIVAYLDTKPIDGMFMGGGDSLVWITFHKMNEGLYFSLDFSRWYDTETDTWQVSGPDYVYYSSDFPCQGMFELTGHFYDCDGNGYTLVRDGLEWDKECLSLLSLDDELGFYRASSLKPETSTVTYNGHEFRFIVSKKQLNFHDTTDFSACNYLNEIVLADDNRTFYCFWDAVPGMKYEIIPTVPEMLDIIMHEGYAELTLKPEFCGPDTIYVRVSFIVTDGDSQFSEETGVSVSFAGLDRFVCQTEAELNYSDVPEDAWYAENVRSANAYGLMIGTGNNMFKPTSNITIAELITLACRMNNTYNNRDYIFFKTDSWYQPYVEYAIKYGIIEQGQYQDYTKVATRSDFITILAKALPEREFGAINDVSIEQIPDVGEDSALADEILMFYRSGVLTGTDAHGTFNPDGSITRAEVAAIITRVVDPALRKNVSLS